MNIQLINYNHIAAVKEISDSRFGFNYLNRKYLESFIGDNSLGLVAIHNNEILGMTLIKIGDKDEIAKEFLVGEEFIKEKYKSDDILALRKHLAVKIGYESKGVGSFLVNKGMQELQRRSVNIILSIVWKEGASEALDKILKVFGSVPIKTFDNYWAEDSLLKQYNCPACKILPCKCSAILYARMI